MEFIKISKITPNASKIILKHSSGLKAELSTYGASLTRLQYPDRHGVLQDLVAGYDDPKAYTQLPYTQHNFCMGASIGHYAGRISGGGFTLEDTFYQLSGEEGIQLHGGKQGFDKHYWEVLEEGHDALPYVVFGLKISAATSEYPGNVAITARYALNESSLEITYMAKSDRATVLNLTNHAYFHLDSRPSVMGNKLQIAADAILDVDERLIPTGKLRDVSGTPYDYRLPIGLEFDGHYGLDTPYVLNGSAVAARFYSPFSGIAMDVLTNQPSLVVFTPQKFPKIGLRNEARYGRFPAICFECQNFPDAPNHPNFPSALIGPDEVYTNSIQYRFSHG